MAIRSAVVPWLSGGLVVFGYAAFSWLRSKTKRLEHAPAEPATLAPKETPREFELLATRLEHLPEEQALDFDSERPPASHPAVPRDAALGALFLGRASEALSAFHFGPEWPSTPR